jgi:GT2 family glycosyltransferase
MPDATLVIPARNEGALLAATLRSLGTTPAGARFETVVVDDGSEPPVRLPADLGAAAHLLRTGGVGAAAARNHGARLASAPVLCFCDAHIAFTPGWLHGLLVALEAFTAACPAVGDAARPGGWGYGFTWTPRCETHWLAAPAGLGAAEVPFLPGACLAIRADAFRALGGFDAGLVPWGHEDAELSWACWLSGFRCGVQPRAHVYHHFRQRHPYMVLQRDVDRNLLRVGCLHFGPERLERLRLRLGASTAEVQGVWRAAAARRLHLRPLRRRSDEWFCQRFALPL